MSTSPTSPTVTTTCARCTRIIPLYQITEPCAKCQAIHALDVATVHHNNPAAGEFMRSSSALCLKEAGEFLASDQWSACVRRCQRAVAYSMGVFHMDYVMLRQIADDLLASESGWDRIDTTHD